MSWPHEKERNAYAAWLLLMSMHRPPKWHEIHDMLLLATFYHQRTRRNVGKLALAEKEQVYFTVYLPILRWRKPRKEMYKVFDRQVRKAIKKGLLIEAPEGWYDITEAGKEHLKAKKQAMVGIEWRAINYFSSRYKANRTRNMQEIESLFKIASSNETGISTEED